MTSPVPPPPAEAPPPPPPAAAAEAPTDRPTDRPASAADQPVQSLPGAAPGQVLIPRPPVETPDTPTDTTHSETAVAPTAEPQMSGRTYDMLRGAVGRLMERATMLRERLGAGADEAGDGGYADDAPDGSTGGTGGGRLFGSLHIPRPQVEVLDAGSEPDVSTRRAEPEPQHTPDVTVDRPAPTPPNPEPQPTEPTPRQAETPEQPSQTEEPVRQIDEQPIARPQAEPAATPDTPHENPSAEPTAQPDAIVRDQPAAPDQPQTAEPAQADTRPPERGGDSIAEPAPADRPADRPAEAEPAPAQPTAPQPVGGEQPAEPTREPVREPASESQPATPTPPTRAEPTREPAAAEPTAEAPTRPDAAERSPADVARPEVAPSEQPADHPADHIEQVRPLESVEPTDPTAPPDHAPPTLHDAPVPLDQQHQPESPLHVDPRHTEAVVDERGVVIAPAEAVPSLLPAAPAPLPPPPGAAELAEDVTEPVGDYDALAATEPIAEAEAPAYTEQIIDDGEDQENRTRESREGPRHVSDDEYEPEGSNQDDELPEHHAAVVIVNMNPATGTVHRHLHINRYGEPIPVEGDVFEVGMDIDQLEADYAQ